MNSDPQTLNIKDQTSNTFITALVPYKIFPAKMGGQKGIALFYQYLSRLLPVTILSTKNNESPINEKLDFMPVMANSKLRYINPLLFFRFKNILKKNNTTHLLLEHPYFGWLGLLLKWSCKIKLVIHSHNIEASRFKSMGKWWWRIMWQYEKMIYRNADINFFISDEDRNFAVTNFFIEAGKCHTVTYGIEISKAPDKEVKQSSKKYLQEHHGIKDSEKILVFNGTLNYKPNLDALDNILQKINPLLLENKDYWYKIIICGKGLPAAYEDLKKYASLNIIYAGFVDDIDVYFKGADIFINPVTDGGGIKTKLVEALGNDLNSVSTKSGAFGVPVSICGNKLYIADDDNWADFTNAVMHADTNNNTAQSFYDHFYWGNIASRTAKILS